MSMSGIGILAYFVAGFEDEMERSSEMLVGLLDCEMHTFPQSFIIIGLHPDLKNTQHRHQEKEKIRIIVKEMLGAMQAFPRQSFESLASISSSNSTALIAIPQLL